MKTKGYEIPAFARMTDTPMSHYGTKSYISRSSRLQNSCKSRGEIISNKLHVCRYRFDLPTKNIFYLFFRWKQVLLPNYSRGFKIYFRKGLGERMEF